jgi:hypothetical protein
MRAMRDVAVFAAVVVGIVLLEFGTVSPCGVLRETVRQHDGLAAVLPDSVVDLVLAGQYGQLSPGRCLAILVSNLSGSTPNVAQATRPQTVQPVTPRPNPQPAPAPVTSQDPMQWAAQMTLQATNECRAKRLRGELPTYVASAQCANPTMIEAFTEAHYRYMDLIQLFAAKRIELAARIDHREMTEQQGQLEIQKAYASIQIAERQRDGGAR